MFRSKSLRAKPFSVQQTGSTCNIRNEPNKGPLAVTHS